MNTDDLEHRFAFHPAPDQEKRDDHASVRQSCLRLALHLNDLLPDGREKALVMTHLEDAMMWANAALARMRPPVSGTFASPEVKHAR